MKSLKQNKIQIGFPKFVENIVIQSVAYKSVLLTLYCCVTVVATLKHECIWLLISKGRMDFIVLILSLTKNYNSCTLLAIQTVPIFLIIIVTAVIIKDSTCIDFKSTIRYIHSSVMKVSSISCGLVCKDLLT